MRHCSSDPVLFTDTNRMKAQINEKSTVEIRLCTHSSLRAFHVNVSGWFCKNLQVAPKTSKKMYNWVETSSGQQQSELKFVQKKIVQVQKKKMKKIKE